MVLYSGVHFEEFLVFIVIAACVAILLALLVGYLFNYYLIKELRIMNDKLQNLTDLMILDVRNKIERPREKDNPISNSLDYNSNDTFNNQ